MKRGISINPPALAAFASGGLAIHTWAATDPSWWQIPFALFFIFFTTLVVYSIVMGCLQSLLPSSDKLEAARHMLKEARRGTLTTDWTLLFTLDTSLATQRSNVSIPGMDVTWRPQRGARRVSPVLARAHRDLPALTPPPEAPTPKATHDRRGTPTESPGPAGDAATVRPDVSDNPYEPWMIDVITLQPQVRARAGEHSDAIDAHVEVLTALLGRAAHVYTSHDDDLSLRSADADTMRADVHHALQVYSHLPSDEAHRPLESGRTPTEELVATLGLLVDEARQRSEDSTQRPAEVLSYLRRLNTSRFGRSSLDLSDDAGGSVADRPRP